MKDVRFEFYIGDTYSRDLIIQGYSRVIDEMYLTVKKEDDDKDYLIQLTLGNGIELTDIVYDTDGTTILSRTYNILFYPNDTEGNITMYPEREYPFDIEIVSDDIKQTIMKGVVFLNSATTRRWDE